MVRITALLAAFAPAWAHACGVCFGEPDNPQTNGMNAAIGLLLLVVVAAGGSLVYLIRVAGNPVPDDDDDPTLMSPRG